MAPLQSNSVMLGRYLPTLGEDFIACIQIKWNEINIIDREKSIRWRYQSAEVFWLSALS